MSRSEPAKQVRLSKKEVDERLLIEAAQQDRGRFTELYEKYFHVVYAYVARRTGERAATEDITSEVFRKALANLKRFKWTGAPFGAWLFRIASNIIKDRAKRAAREQTVHTTDGSAVSEPAASARSQQSSLEEAERTARLFRTVEKLPDDQRRVVVMRFAEEKSVREIADELGRSEGAVKQLQFRALQNLRAQMTGDDS